MGRGPFRTTKNQWRFRRGGCRETTTAWAADGREVARRPVSALHRAGDETLEQLLSQQDEHEDRRDGGQHRARKNQVIAAVLGGVEDVQPQRQRVLLGVRDDYQRPEEAVVALQEAPHPEGAERGAQQGQYHSAEGTELGA